MALAVLFALYWPCRTCNGCGLPTWPTAAAPGHASTRGRPLHNRRTPGVGTTDRSHPGDVLIPESQLILRSAALTTGATDDELARLRRRGALQSLQRGAYVPINVLAALDHCARHRLEIQATMSGLRRAAVVSHTSAAVLHGIPLWGMSLGPVHVTRSPPASTDYSSRLRVHVAQLGDREVCELDGVSVTTVPRTLLDLSRTTTFESGVVATDFALHQRLTSSSELAALAAAAIRGIPGSLEASRVVGFADCRSESVGESRSRVAIARLGLAPPTLQLGITTAGGSRIVKCDFGWREDRVVGEFDGKVKYGRLLRPGQSPGDVVFAEKLREDAIRDEGWEVVRWVWADLATPHVIAQRFNRAADRADRRH